MLKPHVGLLLAGPSSIISGADHLGHGGLSGLTILGGMLMFGCCGAESLKFKSPSEEIDHRRLNELFAALKGQGWNVQQVAEVEKCNCPCHVDGRQVMC
ncbi:hypothetical protein B7H18_03515 [Pseudomonas putida]|uniref:Uncharacterized protein n=1 Tax=Pseudomonas putida TaxID=303 RepID=A0A1X0ZJM6_PSEPU|nr:hypothetical protein B7H18_03515 [Pseudomonas putida]ORL58796.1 hypothetical protein B7H17_25035 [Pseudomonas putida]ORL67197.1 hypothetical protein B7H19_19265 [Pseudomonas putida]PLP92106.1 hypothetical protein CX682_09130 [Pseudomonas sp. FFUP_PS_41]